MSQMPLSLMEGLDDDRFYQQQDGSGEINLLDRLEGNNNQKGGQFDIETISAQKPQAEAGKRKKTQKDIATKQNRGHWQEYQNKKYHWFLQLYCRHFVRSIRRRTDKIFKIMANFIGTREAEQCRSHHQKMEKKFKNFFKILKQLRKTHYDSIEPQQVACDVLEEGYKIEYPFLSQQTLQSQKIQISPDENLQKTDYKEIPFEMQRDEYDRADDSDSIIIGKLLFSEDYSKNLNDFNLFQANLQS